MAKQKRQSRNKAVKSLVPDFSTPIDLLKFGSEEDPCFGVLYDPREKECQSCGDCELCAIMLGQNNHLKRNEIEKTQSFKDIEESEIPKGKVTKELRKEVKNKMRQLIKMAGPNGIKVELVVKDIINAYSKDGFTKIRVTKMLLSLPPKSEKLHLNKEKTHITWKETL